MNHTINKESALSTPPVGGRGAYTAPIIELIVLDNEISLALESSPPAGPSEANNVIRPECFNNDPLNIHLT